MHSPALVFQHILKSSWYGKKLGVRNLRTFGCVAYAKRFGPGVTKLADRSIPGVFFGYEPGTKGYRVYDPVNNKLMVTRDVIFDENRAWNWVENGSRQSSETAAPYTFTFQYPDTVDGPAIGDDSGSGADSDSGGALASPAASIPSVGDVQHSPHTPIFGASGSAPAAQIQWATPPSNASADSDAEPSPI